MKFEKIEDYIKDKEIDVLLQSKGCSKDDIKEIGKMMFEWIQATENLFDKIEKIPEQYGAIGGSTVPTGDPVKEHTVNDRILLEIQRFKNSLAESGMDRVFLNQVNQYASRISTAVERISK